MKKLLLLSILALSFSLPASADLKVALIDTSKAFDAYYKTRELATRIAEQEAKYGKEVQDLQAEYQAASQEAEGLAAAVKSDATPPDMKKLKDAALAEKVQDLESMEKEIQQMVTSRKQEIKDELLRSHVQISEDMMRIITAYVGPQGYDLVLDESATPGEASLFPFNSGHVVDLTNDVIARLNASAPAH